MRSGEFDYKFLSELIKEKFKTNANFLEHINAQGLDKKEDSIKKWRQGNSVPKVTELPIIAESLDVFVGDLFINHDRRTVVKHEISIHPEKYYPSNILMVDKLDMRAGAGSAGFMDVPHEGNKVAIDKFVINGLNPRYIKVIEVIGDSM